MILVVKEGAEAERAEALSEQLDIETGEPQENETYLVLDADGLSLRRGELSLRADFAEMLPRLKQSNLEREMLVKAARIKGMQEPLLIDATAGFAEDSIILAAAGFRLIMFEKDPVIAALLEDALLRAERLTELKDVISRMELRMGDSIQGMKELAGQADVICLDPMFPERRKSAAVKKKFQLLHELERPCDNEEELLRAAIEAAPKKRVIKRPAKGAYLAGLKPSHSYEGKAVRYDCLVNVKG